MGLTVGVIVRITLLFTVCEGLNTYNTDSGPKNNDTVGNNYILYVFIYKS